MPEIWESTSRNSVPETNAPSNPWQVSLLDLSAAYGVLAYQGQRVGTSIGAGTDPANVFDLQPEILFEIVDGAQRLIYRYHPESSAVVSPQLSYLLNDILSDEPARWPLYGTGNPLEIGRPAAAIGGMSDDGQFVWAVGYTPSLVAGVWMGNAGEIPLQSVEVNNSAAAVWHALMQFATRTLPAQDWAAPPGISMMDVCDPSGLLPTLYCPEVVKEVFINGTEPITFDNLYQPFRINSETGKLATLYTPLDKIVERVYLVPPPEADAWAEAVGIEQPPVEYDTIIDTISGEPGVMIHSPVPFGFVQGVVVVSGEAIIDEFDFYRLQFGEGLNPTRWIQIGDEGRTPQRLGSLAQWDTAGLDGLYTLQLIVVDTEGQLTTSSVNITIDNQPPTVEIVLPGEGQRIDLASGEQVVLQVNAVDSYGIAQVRFYIDGKRIVSVESAPYSTRWQGLKLGEHSFHVEVIDLAGNMTEKSGCTFFHHQPLIPYLCSRLNDKGPGVLRGLWSL